MAMHLPIGYPLKFNNRSGVYTVVKILGRGASTIAYLTSYDNGTGRSSDRIIKEFCPYSIPTERDDSGALSFDISQQDAFERALKQFEAGGNRQNELRNKTRLRNETPPLLEILYANNTAYLEVTPFEGQTYDNLSSFTLLERMKICLTVAKLVKRYHEEGYLCLDIKPDNIFILTNSAGEFVTEMVEFIDFDSVREKAEIAFGNSLSFTESWAAPEQINIYSVRRISEATDVFTVGELVFWSIFERHSTEDEHRGFSKYPFMEAPAAFAAQMERIKVQSLLRKLFQRTLRSSSRNRFQDMQPIVKLMEEITEELTKKEYIHAQKIVPKRFFLGRNQELDALAQAIDTEKIVFVTGIAGIGKSEFVKQFVQNNQERYDEVLNWTYDGSLVTMLCDESSVSIECFSRYPGQEDEEYAKRKLIKLSNLLAPRSLIIIDNVDTLVSEFDSPEIWALILKLPGKIVVSSRCYEKEYKCIQVREINDIDLLRRLFFKYCPSAAKDDSHIPSIDRIISIAGKHTYEIELLADYTEEKMQLPEDTLSELEKEGFSSLTDASLSVQKDGKEPGATFMEHLKKLMSMSKMTEKQRLLLLKLSLMPAAGINLTDFKEFYGIHDVQDLRWFIKHGFVADTDDSFHTLTVHPTVASVVINAEKTNDTICERFYEDALTAMRRGYDDPSVNQSFYDEVCKYLDSQDWYKKFCKQLYGHRFINRLSTQSKEKIRETIDSVREDLATEYAKSNVSVGVYRQLCDSIAEKTMFFKFQHKLAAQYTTQYVEWFSKYGHYQRLLATIQYSLRLYDQQNSYTYYPDREYAYAVYTELLVSLSQEYSTAIALCIKRLKLAHNEKDWNMASYWCKNLAKLYFLITDNSSFNYQIKNVYYELRWLWQKESRRDPFKNSFAPNVTKNNIHLAELSESMYEFYPPSNPRMMNWNLRMAIRERESALEKGTIASSSSNGVMIAIDRARIAILELDFAAAIQILSVALEPYCSGLHTYSVATKQAAELLGDVYTTIKDYDAAKEWYQKTLQIADCVEDNNPYPVKIKLGRVYNLSGSEESRQHNYSVWEAVKDIFSDNFRRYVADASYNVGDFHFSIGETDTAERFINDALAIYESCTYHRLHNNIGCARCYERLARISCQRENLTAAKEFAQKATALLEEMLGESHPEVSDFKAFLATL